jgi:hypothetical protein
MKKTFRELIGKMKIHIVLVPDFVIVCYLLHNFTVKRFDIDQLLEILELEMKTLPRHAKNQL